MKKRNIKFNNKGYAIIFTLIVISIISMISMGLANTALKQVILSGVARDSTTAFYEADLGSECVLYASDTGWFTNNSTGTHFYCAGHELIFTIDSSSYTPAVIYRLDPYTTSTTINDKCFSAKITKTIPPNAEYIKTVLDIYGYNICNPNNLRTVQRALKITY